MPVVGRATVPVDLDFDASSVQRVGREIERSLNSSLRNTNTQVKRTGDIFSLAIASIAPAASALSVFAAAATSLGAVLVSASGSALSFVGIMGSLTQVVSVSKIAFDNFQKALSATTPAAFAKAIANMGPAARGLVGTLKDLTGAWNAMRAAVQQSVFAGVDAQVRTLAKVGLPVLQRGLVATGRQFNALILDVAKFAESQSFLDRFSAALAGNTAIFATLRQAAVPVLDGILNVFLALQPSAERLAVLVAAIGVRFQTWTQGVGFAQQVDQFMQSAQHSAGQLLTVIGNLGGAFVGIFRATLPAGNQLLDMLIRVTQQFETFTKSVSGQNSIAQWASDGVSAMSAFGGVLVSLGNLLASIANPGVFIGLSRALQKAADTLNSFPVEALSKAIGQLTVTFAPLIGVVIAAGTVLLGFRALISGVGIFIRPLITVVGVLGAAFESISAAVGSFVAVLGPGVASLSDLAVVMSIAAAVFNPVTIALAAVGALLAVVASQSEAFRTRVGNAFSTVKAAFAGFVSTLAPLGAALSSLFSGVGGALGALMPILEPLANVVLDVITNSFTALLGVLGGAVKIITGVVNILGALFHLDGAQFVQGLSQIGSGLAGIFTSLLGEITGAIGSIVTNIGPLVLSALTGLLGVIGGALAGLGALVLGALTGLGGLLVTFFTTTLPTLISQGFQLALNFVIRFVTELPRLIGLAIGFSLGLIFRFVVDVPIQVASMVTSTLSFIGNLASQLPALIGRMVSAAVSSLTRFASQTIQLVGSAVSSAISAAGSFAARIPALVSQGVSAAIHFVGTLPGRMLALGGSLLSAAGSLGGRIIDGLRNVITKGIPQIASSIISGLANVLTGAKGYLVGIAKDLAGGIIDGFVAAIKPGSPSKVFTALAATIPQGIAKGILENVGLVTGAMASLADGLVSTPLQVATVGVNGLGGIGSSVGSGVAPRSGRTPGVSTASNGGDPSTVGGTTIVVNQNNYGVQTAGERLQDLAWAVRFAPRTGSITLAGAGA